MPFATPAEFLAFARDRGLLPAERIDELATDPTLPANVDDFLSTLRERGLLSTDFADETTTDMSNPVATYEEATDPSTILFTDEPYALPVVATVVSGHVRGAPKMSRETMWTWFAVGGGLWLIGLVVLGAWLGGCLNETPPAKARPQNATR